MRGSKRSNEERASPKWKRPIRKGSRQPAIRGREMCRYNCAYGREWQGKRYAIKQVAPIIKEEANEIVVITVYTFYF